jgi:hypothetical protein
VHRALSVVAAASLLVGLRTIWINATTDGAGFGLIVTLCYFAVLSLIVAALCCRDRRSLVRIDLLVLVVASLIELTDLHRFVVRSFTYDVDEGVLTAHAMTALRHGVNPYRPAWPHAVSLFPTQLMGGGIVDRFDYPPLSAVLGAAAGLVWHGLATPAVLDGVALLAAGVIMFVAFPPRWRPLAVLVTFGIGFDATRAASGDPAVIALPFLAVALWQWPKVGAGGELGRSGIVRAVCLGLAAATQQLAWFIVPFVVVGMWRVRRGELPPRQAATVIGRCLAISAATFAVVNLPFAIAGPVDWWQGVTSVLTQHAVIYGPGLAMISDNILPVSGALGFYNYATGLLYIAFLVMFAVGIKRFGTAAAVLPMAVFLLSVRSQDTYYLVFAPVWIMTAVTTSRADFASAPPLSLPTSMPTWLHRPRTLRGATIGLYIPALACLIVAVATPRPLHMRVLSTTADAASVAEISVDVLNTSSHLVAPHFVLVTRAEIGRYWRVATGPSALRPGQQARYELLAPVGGTPSVPDASMRLVAVSDDPQTISTVVVPRAG